MVAPVTAIAEAPADAGKEQDEDEQQYAKPSTAAPQTVKSHQNTASLRAAAGRGGRVPVLRLAPLLVFSRAVLCFQPRCKARVPVGERHIRAADVGHAFKESVKELAHALVVVALGKVRLQILVDILLEDARAQFQIEARAGQGIVIVIVDGQQHEYAVVLARIADLPIVVERERIVVDGFVSHGIHGDKDDLRAAGVIEQGVAKDDVALGLVGKHVCAVVNVEVLRRLGDVRRQRRGAEKQQRKRQAQQAFHGAHHPNVFRGLTPNRPPMRLAGKASSLRLKALAITGYWSFWMRLTAPLKSL